MTDLCPMPHNLGDLIGHNLPADLELLIDLSAGDTPARFSAGELRGRVQAFARWLRKRGIRPGDRVAFVSDNRWEFLLGYLGTLYMGAVAVPVNHKFSREVIAHILNDAAAALVLCDAPRAELLPSGFTTIGIDGAELFAASLEAGQELPYVPGPDDLAEILYTSGSTGKPKGVPLTHSGQLWALSHYLAPRPAADEREVSLIVAPLYHMNALFFASVCLLNGTRILLQSRFEASAYIDAVARYQCTLLTGIPTMFAMVEALGDDKLPANLTSVKTISIGSAPLSLSLLDKIQRRFPAAEVSNGYGSTEAGPAIFGPHPSGKPKPELSIGYPMEDIEWRLAGGIDNNEGVLELKTPAMTGGYLNRPEATSERFVSGWFSTGDIMRRDEQGFFYFVSRADDMFVCGGENIYPGEVEAIISRHPAVSEAVVVGAPDDIKGSVPVAFVVPKPDLDVSEDDLKKHSLAQAPAYAHPRRVIFKQALPLGGTHKIDRRALETEAAEQMMASGRASRISS